MVGNNALLAIVRLEMRVVTLVVGGVVGVKTRFAVIATRLVAMMGLPAAAFGGKIDCRGMRTAGWVGGV